MTDVEWTPLPVPWAVRSVDRIPKQRYYDQDFYALETELFWPRVWQMACRLEEIPKPGDFVEYEILDQSIIVVRVDASSVRAYYNACRHRGMKLVEGCGSRRTFVCPFHGWCWGLDGKNTFVLRSEMFDEANLDASELELTPVRCELWGGCAWINLDDDAPPLRDCIEPFASRHDEFKVEALRTEWWKSCLLPVNWKLATAAFMEGYHVPQTHPQLLPSAYSPDSSSVHPVVQASLYFMRTLGSGMGGMTHENDIRIAEGLQHMSLPDDPAQAMATWRGALNDAVTTWHRARDCDFPDLNDLDRRRADRSDRVLLPALLHPSAVQQRVVIPDSPAGPGGDAVRGLVADPLPERPSAREAHRTRAAGSRRSELADDSRPGLLQPAEAAEGTARQGVPVHEVVGSDRGIDLQLRAGRRRLSRGLAVREPGAGDSEDEHDNRCARRRPRALGEGSYMVNWDASVDLLIAGSGGGGMVAALAALDAGIEPLVVEKQNLVGGSTGMSGGMVWLPNNPLMRADGIPDTHEDGLAYFDDVVGDIGEASSTARRETFLTAGNEMLNLLVRKGVRLVRCPGWSDYYPNHKGGNAAGRSVEGVPYDAAALGDWSDKVQPSMAKNYGFVVKTNELRAVQYFNRSPRAFATATRVFLRTNLGQAPAP